jgi:hypothetical protein
LQYTIQQVKGEKTAVEKHMTKHNIDGHHHGRLLDCRDDTTVHDTLSIDQDKPNHHFLDGDRLVCRSDEPCVYLTKRRRREEREEHER